jgi:hypothetical protein
VREAGPHLGEQVAGFVLLQPGRDAAGAFGRLLHHAGRDALVVGLPRHLLQLVGKAVEAAGRLLLALPRLVSDLVLAFREEVARLAGGLVGYLLRLLGGGFHDVTAGTLRRTRHVRGLFAHYLGGGPGVPIFLGRQGIAW